MKRSLICSTVRWKCFSLNELSSHCRLDLTSPNLSLAPLTTEHWMGSESPQFRHGGRNGSVHNRRVSSMLPLVTVGCTEVSKALDTCDFTESLPDPYMIKWMHYLWSHMTVLETLPTVQTQSSATSTRGRLVDHFLSRVCESQCWCAS